MACSSCGNKGKGNVNQDRRQTGENLQALYDTGNFVFAKYIGPSQTHNIGSPTGVIVEYGMGVYGRGKNGDIFLVHKKDADKKFGKFQVIEGGAINVAAKMYGVNITPVNLTPTTPVVAAKTVAPVEEAFVPKNIVESEAFEEVVSGASTESDKLTEALDEIIAVASESGTNDSPLKRSEAMLIKDFVPQFGYTHQLQVMAKIRVGELKSYKNDDGKTMVYHVED